MTLNGKSEIRLKNRSEELSEKLGCRHRSAHEKECVIAIFQSHNPSEFRPEDERKAGLVFSSCQHWFQGFLTQIMLCVILKASWCSTVCLKNSAAKSDWLSNGHAETPNGSVVLKIRGEMKNRENGQVLFMLVLKLKCPWYPRASCVINSSHTR